MELRLFCIEPSICLLPGTHFSQPSQSPLTISHNPHNPHWPFLTTLSPPPTISQSSLTISHTFPTIPSSYHITGTHFPQPFQFTTSLEHISHNPFNSPHHWDTVSRTLSIHYITGTVSTILSTYHWHISHHPLYSQCHWYTFPMTLDSHQCHKFKSFILSMAYNQ